MPTYDAAPPIANAIRCSDCGGLVYWADQITHDNFHEWLDRLASLARNAIPFTEGIGSRAYPR